ncbi:MAG: hypothetical protein UW37_C0036G0007 [Candidatus Gottesmanbacteria bacterium GW2011_GWA2_44_17]|uniref:Type 4 fimbrial biogenesis protein PilX N-terminal domain-containing protein n=1 Tax=Candidatus Gottesmanbacteria bacterium GW2011_GWA2_44_17 TaxID=1618444 RepID=A0A0G1JPS0_9BACT|nr:MAG: hypothetical protein UW37_C0036G0007 [Candidatus Gottesmanbacteria bacterium GW2011_GWA2_44_17]
MRRLGINKMKKLPRKLKGESLLIGIILLTVLLILAAALFSRVAGFLRFGSNTILREQALYLAEAGLEKAIWQLNETAGNYTGETNTFLPGQPDNLGQFTVSVTTINPALKTITSTGCVPKCASPLAKVTVKSDAKIGSTTIAFSYAAQTGDGGILMNQSSKIDGTAYSNGNISGGLGSGQVIEGDAWAVGTISNPPDVGGQRHPNASAAPMPDITQQVSDWKTAATAGGTTTCPCYLSTSQNIGPRKYVGNLTLTGNATFTVKGPIWVTGGIPGNLLINLGSTKVNLDESFGSNGTGFVVDGTISILNGATINPTSADPKGYIMLVSNSSNNSAVNINNSGAFAILYALIGGAQMSQNTTVNTLISKSLTMSQGSKLDYQEGLASAQFTTCPTCPGASWQPKKGTYYYSK